MKLTGDYQTGEVFVSGRKLYPDLSLKSFNHSPDGFSWGYAGSGPAQLALALLLMATDEETAVRLHQTFKKHFIASLPQDDFETQIDVESWIRANGGNVNRSNWETSLDGKEKKRFTGSSSICTPGHEDQCQKAHATNCDCNCNGSNHGSAVRI